jgi:hypothetical protein
LGVAAKKGGLATSVLSPDLKIFLKLKKLFSTGLHGLFCTDFARD